MFWDWVRGRGQYPFVLYNRRGGSRNFERGGGGGGGGQQRKVIIKWERGVVHREGEEYAPSLREARTLLVAVRSKCN